MPVPRYKKSAWNNATNGQKQFLRLVWSKLNLGVPVEGTIGASTTRWLLFHDSRITHRSIAILHWANQKIAAITDEPVLDYAITEIVQIQVPVRVQIPALEANGDPVLDDNGDPVLIWVDDPSGATQTVDQEQSLGDASKIAADAQGTVPWFDASDELPNGWSPVDPGA